jgi:hypothetical protein
MNLIKLMKMTDEMKTETATTPTTTTTTTTTAFSKVLR